MAVKKIIDPTGFFAKLEQLEIAKVAAGYVPAFIERDNDMIGQLLLSHNVSLSPMTTFNPKDLTVTMGVVKTTLKPLALVESNNEKLYIYNHGIIAWFVQSLPTPMIYLATPKEETMRLSIRQL